MITRVVTAGEMKEIDRISIEEIGIPSSVLMNNAGKAVADFISREFPGRSVCVFCGKGNNGGDGFTAAYYLFNMGYNVTVYLSGSKDEVPETSGIFLSLCRKSGIEIHEVNGGSLSSVSLPPDCIIIDAVFGTGFDGAARGIPLEFIKKINETGVPVVSVDIPSGLPSDGKAPGGESVYADYTITIGLPKISLVTYPGKSFCGKLITADIGFPSSLTSSDKLKAALINDELIRIVNINNCTPDIHKGDRGYPLFVGGFKGMEGAALMTASAMFKTGCGLMTIATEENSRNIIAGKIPEAMTKSLPNDPEMFFPEEYFKSSRYTSLIIGPGLGRTIYAEKIFYRIIKSLAAIGIKKVLIDGDGLFHLAGFLKKGRLPEGIDYVITPHFMEASRIISRDIDEIRNDRFTNCIEIAGYTGCVTVLKGPASIVSDGNRVCINTTGNNGLATAGSGDVLSGIIGSFMNTGIPVFDAAITGVYIHGLCADIYSMSENVLTMNASDIIQNIRSAINTIHI